MELPIYLKPLLIGQVRGKGMAPKLRPGQHVVATRLFRRLRPGNVVVIERGNKQTIKRIERVEANRLFVIGDNLDASVDSRQFGWLDRGEVVAKVLRPNMAK